MSDGLTLHDLKIKGKKCPPHFSKEGKSEKKQVSSTVTVTNLCGLHKHLSTCTRQISV